MLSQGILKHNTIFVKRRYTQMRLNQYYIEIQIIMWNTYLPHFSSDKFEICRYKLGVVENLFVDG